MKNERGITLVALMIYVILMTFIIAAVSSITAAFYTNINEFDNESESVVSFAKFNMYFLNDIKRENAKIEETYDDYIILSYVENINSSEIEGSGDVVVSDEETRYVEYSVQNNILYRDKVKICEDVEDVLITSNPDNQTISIYLKIGDYEKTTSYVIESFGVRDTNIEI